MSTSPLDSTRLEREFVGAVYYEPELLDAQHTQPADFHDRAAATVLRGQMALREAGEQIDPVSVREWVLASGETWTDFEADHDVIWTPRAADRLAGMAEMRRTRDALKRALALSEAGNVSGTRAAVLDLTAAQDTHQAGQSVSLGDEAVRAAESVLDPDTTPRIYLGLDCLYNAIGGAGPGDMVVIGADTGIGKSSLALSMALGMAPRTPVGIVSCEDGPAIWGARAAARFTGVSSLRMLTGTKDPQDLSRLANLVAHPQAPAIGLECQIGKPEVDVLGAMRRLARMGAKVIFVDYLQTILSSDTHAQRKDQVRVIAARLKGQAASLGVLLVLVSQLSRPAKGDPKREPGKHDLKESGDIENAAEVIILLWPGEADNVLNMKIDKCKWGCRQPLHTLYRDKSGSLVEYEEARVVA